MILEKFNLSGKVALVTGCSAGLREATSCRLEMAFPNRTLVDLYVHISYPHWLKLLYGLDCKLSGIPITDFAVPWDSPLSQIEKQYRQVFTFLI